MVLEDKHVKTITFLLHFILLVVVVQIYYIRQQPKCEDEPWDRPTNINDNYNVMQQIIFICIFAHTCIYYYIWIKIIKSLL